MTPGEPLLVRGVVTLMGAAGGQMNPDPNWYLSFGVRPWRRAEGPLVDRELRVRMPIERDALDRWMAKLRPGEAVEFEIAGEPVEKYAAARMLSFAGPCDDGLLSARAAELSRPRTIEDPLFGTLSYDHKHEWYEAKVAWCGASVSLALVGDAEDEAGALDMARRLWAESARWQRDIADRIVAELLATRNQVWRQAGEPVLDAARFLAALTLTEISVGFEGDFTFYFDDGDLFWGHCVLAAGSLGAGIDEVKLAG